MSIESNAANASCQSNLITGRAQRALNYQTIKCNGDKLRYIRKVAQRSEAWPTAGKTRYLVNQARHLLTYTDPRTKMERTVSEGCIRLLDALIGMASKEWNNGDYTVRRYNAALAQRLSTSRRTVQIRLAQLEWTGVLARTYSQTHQRSVIDLAPLLSLLPKLRAHDEKLRAEEEARPSRAWYNEEAKFTRCESSFTLTNIENQIYVECKDVPETVDNCKTVDNHTESTPERLTAQVDNQYNQNEPPPERLTAQGGPQRKAATPPNAPPNGGIARQEKSRGGGELRTVEYYAAIGSFLGTKTLAAMLDLSPSFRDALIRTHQNRDTQVTHEEIGRALDALRHAIKFNQAQWWTALITRGNDAVMALILAVESDNTLTKACYLNGILKKSGDEFNPVLSLKAIKKRRNQKQHHTER